MTIERRLSSVLSEFARTLGTDFPIQAILDHLVLRIVEVLPISAAGVTLIAPGTEPRFIAASDESALRFEMLQTELSEGPCLGAFETGRSVSVPDLRDDDRFPTFASRALEEGLVAVFTFPLRHDEQQLGALDLYRTTAGELDEEAMAAAQTLADVAAAYLINAKGRADLQRSSEQARHLSLHDDLTGLANRALLVERLDHALMRCRRSNNVVAVLYADLDVFKSVNDAYGHHVGDELLVAVARRLSQLLRPGDTLARLAGDEFVILCEELSDRAQVEPLAVRISTALAIPFDLSSGEVSVSASIGIAVGGAEVATSAQLLEEADSAMYKAKRDGGARHQFVEAHAQGGNGDPATLSRDLSKAVEREQLHLEYQPIVTTVDRRVVAVEALLRWLHPTRGLIPPDTLIPLAETSASIHAIGSWVLRTACLNAQRSREAVRISVNVSTPQLMADGFARSVASVLEETGTTPSFVTLEVTEHLFRRDADRARSVLDALKAVGVRIAIDNFGTGHSSLSYLSGYPVDSVKIDRSVLANFDRASPNRLFVKAVAELAHGLGQTVVAVGVETSDQFDDLYALGCDACQGFLVGRPMSSRDLAVVLAGHPTESHLFAS